MVGYQNRRGDQYVTVTIETPKNLNKEQKELLKAFADASGEETYAKRKSFFEKVKDNFKNESRIYHRCIASGECTVFDSSALFGCFANFPPDFHEKFFLASLYNHGESLI